MFGIPGGEDRECVVFRIFQREVGGIYNADPMGTRWCNPSGLVFRIFLFHVDQDQLVIRPMAGIDDNPSGQIPRASHDRGLFFVDDAAVRLRWAGHRLWRSQQQGRTGHPQPQQK